MLKEEIIKWVEKTFGKPRHRDNFEMLSKISEVSKNGAMVRIEELNFVFQRIENDVNEKQIKIWKKELDVITGNSLRAFHLGNNETYGIASEVEVKKGAQEGELVKRHGSILNVQIFKETFMHNEVLFPHNIGSNRRH